MELITSNCEPNCMTTCHVVFDMRSDEGPAFEAHYQPAVVAFLVSGNGVKVMFQ